MGMPPSHIYYGTDSGDNDPRFGSGGSSGGEGWIALFVGTIIAFFLGLALPKIYDPWWGDYVLFGIGILIVVVVATTLVIVFRKEKDVHK